MKTMQACLKAYLVFLSIFISLKFWYGARDAQDLAKMERISFSAIQNRQKAVTSHVLEQDPRTWSGGGHSSPWRHQAPKALVLMADQGPNAPGVLDMVDVLLSVDPADWPSMYLAQLTAMADGAWSNERTSAVKSYFESFDSAVVFGGGTANQFMSKAVLGILFGEQFPDAIMSFAPITGGANATGAEVALASKERLRAYGQKIFATSPAEHLSATYTALHTGPLAALYAFSTDLEVRLIAGAMMDYLFTDWAVNSLENSVAVFERYKKPLYYDLPQGSFPRESMQWVSWLFFGAENVIIDENNDFLDTWNFNPRSLNYTYMHAVSDYLPPNAVLNLGLRSHQSAYSVRQKLGSFSCTKGTYDNEYRSISVDACVPDAVMREVYTTNDYMLGLAYTKEIISDLSYPTHNYFGAIWRSANAHNELRISHPFFYWGFTPYSGANDGEPWEEDDWAQFSPFRAHGMNNNVYLAIYDLALDDPYTGTDLDTSYSDRSDTIHQAIYAHIPDTMALDEVKVDGRRYYADGDVYLMIRPFHPTSVVVESSGHSGYGRLKMPGSKTGCFIMFGSAEEHTNLAGFKAHTDDATFTMTNLLTTGEASYTHTDGTSLSVTHAGVVNVNPTVVRDGVTLAIDKTWPEFSSPYASRADGVLTVIAGSESLEIDWSGDLPVYGEPISVRD